MLLRFQHLILLTPFPSASSANSQQDQDELFSSSAELTPLQKQIQTELWSPLPYHRTKWLHSIENARSLLLQLERTAQNTIKVQKTKQEALKNLAAKRAVVKALRNRVEEIGREVEKMGNEEAWKLQQSRQDEQGQEGEGDTIHDILLRKRKADPKKVVSGIGKANNDTALEKPISQVHPEGQNLEEDEQTRDGLFESSSTIRRRQGQSQTGPSPSSSKPVEATTSGFSDLQGTERKLLDTSREHEDITASLISMAAQLKQQARAFQFTLDQDKGLLNRALEGLDRNIGGMEVASKNMAFLKRMSEGEGWLGRLKLYAMIIAMWIVAILLVFVGPKLRF